MSGTGDIEKSAIKMMRYSDWRLMGKGGTSNVYRVRDNELGYDVAIKIIKPEILRTASDLETIKRHLRPGILGRFRHPNICTTHEFYDGPEGFGTVMDLVNGIDLRDWMNSHLDDLLDTADIRLDLLRKIAEALSYAHTRECSPGIIHGNLKPQTIFLRDGDIRQPVIMKFGWSQIDGRYQGDGAMPVFAPKYLAPEQFETPDQVDGRADLFALGILAYELFTGRIPPHSLKDLLRTRKPPRIPLHEILPPSDVNGAVRPALDRIILQLTAYEPDRRIQSADELASLLASPATLLYPPPFEWPIHDEGPLECRSARAVAVPGGEYILGSRPGRKTTNVNELPARKILLTPFRIDRTPVTNREYQQFVAASGRSQPPFHNHPVFGAPDHPVVGVTFDEAMQFARWAGGMLPSEAQWEYAARAGQKLIEYPWGDEPPTPLHANINNISRTTSIVGTYPEGSNQFEIYDMCGNVWEWCMDVYEQKFYATIHPGAINPVNNPRSVNAEAQRVLRGGSFQSLFIQGRCACRFSALPTESRHDIGFRLVYCQNRRPAETEQTGCP